MKRLLLNSFAIFCLLLSVSVAAYAQGRTISGKVTSKDDGTPLPGVTVMVKGTTVGTQTDVEGAYKLSVGDDAKILVFSFVGYTSVEREIGSQTSIDIILQEITTTMNEVVVIGYGTAIKQDLTGNIAKVSAKDIQNTPTPSFEQAIQGRAAGVSVSTESGKIGGGVRMRIRGSSSVSAGNEPLYVVDGVIITSESQSVTESRLNPLADLNMNDIASIDILKDAQAAAIYGARAANGVIIITTKKGLSGKTKFNLGYQHGWSSPTGKREFVSTADYVKLLREAGKNVDDEAFALSLLEGYSGGKFDPANPDNIQNVPNTNWQDLIYSKDAGISQFDLSAQGGNDKTQFFISGQRSLQNGILIGNSMERFTGRFTLDHNVSTKFKIGLSNQIANTLTKRLADDNEFSSLMQIVAMPPVAPVFDVDGNYSNDRNDKALLPYYNPLINTIANRFDATTFRSIGSAYASYEIIKGLSLKTEFSLDYMRLTEDRYWGRQTLEGRDGKDGVGELSNTAVANYTTTTFLNYNKVFAEKHNLSLTLGQSFQKSTTDTDLLAGQKFPSDKLSKLSSAATKTDAQANRTQYTFASYFARANYKFNNRYLFSLSGRVDGSSRFGENSRYGFFPAISAGWILSEETFLKENKIVSFLKLRASYGLVGNAAIPNNLHQSLVGSASVTVGGTAGYAGTSGLRYIQIGNPNLTWETTSQVDIGLDFGILKDRITGEIDFYQKNTRDLLLQRPIPTTSGFATQWANVGSLKNYGFEFVINTANLVGDLKWNTNFNIAINRNEITSLGADSILDVRGSRYLNVAKVGQPIGTFYGREYAGVNPDNGDALYYLNNGTKDAKGNRATTNDFNQAKDAVLGNPNPNWIGGLTNTFSYKGVELSFLLQWVQGNQIFNGAGVFMSANFIYEDNQTTDQLKRWQKPGDITDVPQFRLYVNNGSNASSRYLTDGSYLRLRNVQLAYNVPTKWLSKAKLSSARIYIIGQNLLTFTPYKGWDPEVSTDYLGATTTNYNLFLGNDFYSTPQIKSFTVGVNVGF